MDNKFQAHYAAMKILRQRCEYLQKRLDLIEEENCQLKLQKVQVQEKAVNNASYNHCLEEQIILLNKQNDRMSHQIQVISTENQNLWSQLSTFISGDEALGHALTVSTAPGYRGDVISTDPVNKMMEDCNKESLEEISLKLITGILIGKTELESQYSQMIDLQKENNPPEKSYLSKVPSHFDCRTTVGAIKGMLKKLNDFKEALHQQKKDLNSAIKTIKNYSSQKNILNNSENLVSANIKSRVEVTNMQDNRDRRAIEESITSDKTCPMCSRTFTGNFNIFYEHVTSHFEDGNEEMFNVPLFN